MPDAKDYQRAMEKVTAGTHWKESTLEKIRGAQSPRTRRTIHVGRRAVPLATAAAICLLVIPAAARGLSAVSGGAAVEQAMPRMAAARQIPENAAGSFALEAVPETGAGADTQDKAAGSTVPAYTLVEADSPQAALPAGALPADDAPGRETALDLLEEILAAEGEGRTRTDVLAGGLLGDGSFAFVLADPGQAGRYRLYALPPAP